MTLTIKYFSYQKKNYGSHFFLKNHSLRKNRIFQFIKKHTWSTLLKNQNHSFSYGKSHVENKNLRKNIGNRLR